jgi:predicted metalloprotease with PDZ domain
MPPMGILRHFLIAASLLATAAPSWADAPCELEYRFTARFDDSPRRFEVELLFDAAARTQTQVRVAREWAGVSDFERAIGDVRPGAAGIAVSPGSEAKKTWKVRHPAASRVSVKYELVNDVGNVDAETPIQQRDFYRAMIGAAYFQLFGWGALVVPESLPDTDPVEACMTFSGLAKDGAFASTYGDGQIDGVATMRMHASPLELRSAVYLGGDFRIHRRDIEGRPLVVAMRGDWSFDDAKFVDTAAAVVRAERAFWNDFEFPRYLISLIPNRLPGGSTGGTGLRNSFATHASKDFTVPGPAFEHLIAHEHLHTWIPRRIGTMGEHEAERYWFSEGFTDYFTHRLLLASGVWTLDDYAKALDGVILRYESSLARNAPNAVVAAEFWSNPAAQRIPYFRGELVALRWSGAMAARGGSLEETLRELRRDTDATRDEPEARPEDLATNRLVAALRKTLGPAVDRDVAAFVDAGESIPVTSGFLGPCFHGERVSRPLFELGFDFPSSENRTVTHLVRGSAAEKAGVREGMVLAGWSIYGGDLTKEVELHVQEGAAVTTLKYRALAAHGVEVYEFDPIRHALESSDCRRWIRAR